MSNPTTPFGWQMPTNTDLVTDLPADFEVFGQAVATSLADLLGGTTGQVLAKNTNADMDFVWQSPNPGDITGVTAGTGISGGGTSGDVTITNSMATAIDAKGDLIVGTAADTFSRLAVGATNGHVLTIDSAEATGLKWAASTGEKTILVPQNSATYLKYFTTSALSQDNPVEDTTYYMPFYLPGYAIDRLSIRTGGAFSGTATVRLGLYNASSTTGKPTTVYLDAGTVSCTAASTNYEITISNTPPAGYYYFAFNMQTSATTPEFASFNNAAIMPNIYLPTTSTVNTTTYQHVYTETGITGSFATAGTLVVGTLQARFFALRIA